MINKKIDYNKNMENETKIRKSLTKIKEQQAKLGREVKEKTTGYILAALGLVVGLAWNDAIKSIIEYVFPLDKNSILAKLVYALLVTIIVVLVSAYFIRSNKEKEN
jgi:septation ring formation regulator EzrA